MLAVAAMVACSTEHTVVAPANNDAIGFDTFVDNSTRANDVTNATLQDFGFNVYASVTNGTGTSGLILDNEEVTYDGAWSYEKTQYWVAGNTYNFAAFAPADGAKWAYTPAEEGTEHYGTAHYGIISFNNRAAAANQDLVFAYANRAVAEAYTSTPESVKFTFGHMLSRVRFTFTNSFQSAGNIKLVVSDVHITDAYANGTLAVENGAPVAAWTNLADKTLDVEFGDAAATIEEGKKQSTEHFYLIPNSESATYTVAFNVTLIQAGVEIDTYEHEVELTCAMNRGGSYDIKTSLTPENTSDDDSVIYPIVFDVEKVEEWGNYSEVALEAKTVATAAELATAIAEGGDIRLTQNIALDANGLTIAKQTNIDLNGKTLTVAASNFVNESTLTLSNGTVSGSDSQAGRRAIVNKGNLTMNNVTVAQVYAGGGSAINNDGTTAVAVLNNVTVNAQNMAVSNKNGAKMTINGGNFVGNGTGKSYAIVNQLGSTMTINGGTFEGGHGVVSSTEASETTLNGGTYHCTCTCTGNSDWVLYTSYASGEEEPGYISYNEANCTFTTVRTDGTIYYSACESQITKL